MLLLPDAFPFPSVTMDEIDGIGHWASNTCHEVYVTDVHILPYFSVFYMDLFGEV